MDFRKPLLLLPIFLIVFISGCTSIPCIPFLNIGNCGVVEFEHDVIIIKSLDALPKTVSPGQQIRLVTYIQNTGKDTVPQTDGVNKLEKIDDPHKNIVVNLYDYCKGLFSEVKVGCEGKPLELCDKNTGEGCECKIEKLLPGQVKEVSWTLKAGDKDQVPLKTDCNLKVSVTYPYKTTSLSDITFIDYNYMQHQMNQGTFRTKDSYIVSGYGPVKPWITVEDQQPIPVQDGKAGKTVIALRVKNSGKGYLCRPLGSIEGDEEKTDKAICDSKIPKSYVTISGIEGGLEYNQEQGATCLFPESQLEEDVTLINRESAPYICEIQLKAGINLPKEATEHVTTEIEYLYEFRKETKITIEPKI